MPITKILHDTVRTICESDYATRISHLQRLRAYWWQNGCPQRNEYGWFDHRGK